MPSSNSSSSASTSPAPEKRSKKDKGKIKSIRTDESHGRNEGTDPNWAYVPPPGLALVKNVTESEEFDWDSLNDDSDTELWVIRVPDTLKAKHLEDAKFELGEPSVTSRVGSIQRKNTSYDIWAVGEDGQGLPVGGEEVKGLSCLVPRKKKKGQLRLAPKPIARHFVVSTHEAKPQGEEESGSPVVYQNPPRPSYPEEVLKHTFMPIGSEVKGVEPGTTQHSQVMDIDPKLTTTPLVPTKHSKTRPEKRKLDGPPTDPPKKGKKAKKV